MRIAYADPPYIGQAKRYYGDHPDYAGEVDHEELIAQLCDVYPDGWALSLHSPSLREILNLCPDDVRVMAWCKTFASWRKNVLPTYAWEPVIMRGGRKPKGFIHDWHASAPAFIKGFVGAKPELFCHWLFSCLGLEDGDDLVDLFPGTGMVARSWDAYRRQGAMSLAPAANVEKDNLDMQEHLLAVQPSVERVGSEREVS